MSSEINIEKVDFIKINEFSMKDTVLKKGNDELQSGKKYL